MSSNVYRSRGKAKSLRDLTNTPRGDHRSTERKGIPKHILGFCVWVRVCPVENCRKFECTLACGGDGVWLHTKTHSRLKVLFSSTHLRIHLSSSGLPFHQPPPSLSTTPIIFITTCSPTPATTTTPHSFYCYYHQQAVGTIVAIQAAALLSS